MSDFKTFMKGLGDLGIPLVSSVANMAVGLLGSKLQKGLVNNRMSGAEREAFNLSAQEAQKARDWNLQMDNTKYQRQVADMQSAGINPALAMSGGVSTQATSNATGNASTQYAPMMSVVDMATTAAALKSAKADQADKEASAALKKESERGERIRNDVDEITLLDLKIASLEETRSRTDVNDETKKKIQQEIDNLKAQKDEIISRTDLNKDQHAINEYIKSEMAVKLEYLPQQLQADIAEAWSRAGLNKAQIDTEVANLESLDWKNAKTVTYSYARSIGARVNFNLFKNIVTPGRYAGAKGGEQGLGAGADFKIDEHTEGILIYDRKTKELQFIPTFGYFKDSKEAYKEGKKEEKKEERKNKKDQNK